MRGLPLGFAAGQGGFPIANFRNRGHETVDSIEEAAFPIKQSRLREDGNGIWFAKPLQQLGNLF
jgi:hypothetical protein